jgi:hypothetical protein
MPGTKPPSSSDTHLQEQSKEQSLTERSKQQGTVEDEYRLASESAQRAVRRQGFSQETLDKISKALGD